MIASPSAPIAFVTMVMVAATAGSPVRAAALNLDQNQVAQNYPWCLISSAYEGGENCGFSTFEQCQASRLGIGGFCQSNPQYRPGVAPFSPHAPGIHRQS